MSDRRFKVIIVGGSVTGLTLAHSLHKIGVDYTILEKRPSIAPQEGASIGILPNGARVLDQLGLYGAIEQATAPLGATHVHFQDGFSFTSHYPKRMLENFGYPIAFLERRKLLEILYDALPDKNRVHVNKAVSSISQYTEGGTGGVRVRTLDGHVCEGDIVVGADGVHSRTRSEMWRLSNLSGQSASDGSTMSMEYSCCFGISTGVPELRAGEQVMRIYNGQTLVVIPSKDGLVFWFLVQKLDRRYKYGEAPRFTPKQAAAQCLQLADATIGNDVQFGHVWQRRQTFNMVPLEENLFRTWSFGRLVCIGDSMHKMTVNLGQGANCAIEDVAILSNLLHAHLKENKSTEPSDEEVGALLRRFNRLHLSRVAHICSMSRTITRVHAREGLGRKIAGRYLMPHFAKRFESRPFNMIADAAALDFLPLPRSSFPGWEKFKSKQGRVGFWTVVLPLLLLLVAVKMFFGQ